jgi:hypothetical protein
MSFEPLGWGIGSLNSVGNSLVLSGIALGKKVRKNFYTARLEQ